MKVFSYCTQVARQAVGRALGVEPYASPPITPQTFPVDAMNGANFIYLRLHGLPGADVWMGEGVIGGSAPAFDGDTMSRVDLPGSVILIANCYATDSPLTKQFYKRGASVVIAGDGPNYAGNSRIVGTDLLARWLLLGLRAGFSTDGALALARLRLMLSAGMRGRTSAGIVYPQKDTLNFSKVEPDREGLDAS